VCATVWPLFLAIVIGSLAWFSQDAELRRGLGQITGFHAIEPIIEEVINREFMMTVHGTWSSSCTQRVLVAALEKDLEYELKLVNMTAVREGRAQSGWLWYPGKLTVDDRCDCCPSGGHASSPETAQDSRASPHAAFRTGARARD
jgi:hypothetical protein